MQPIQIKQEPNKSENSGYIYEEPQIKLEFDDTECFGELKPEPCNNLYTDTEYGCDDVNSSAIEHGCDNINKSIIFINPENMKEEVITSDYINVTETESLTKQFNVEEILEKSNVNNYVTTKNTEITKNVKEQNDIKNIKKKTSTNKKPITKTGKEIRTIFNKNGEFNSLIILNCQKCNETRKLIENQTKQCGKCKKDMKYVCQECKAHFIRYDRMLAHLKTPRCYYYCNDCSYKNKKKYRLQDHIQRIHCKESLPVFKCHKCNMTYKGKDSLYRHQKICGVPVHLFCTFCSYKTRKESYLAYHLSKNHIDKLGSEKELDSLINIIVKKGKAFKEDSKKALARGMQFSRKITAIDRINRCCIKCDKTYDPKEYKKMKNCPECDTTFLFECQKCKKKDNNYNFMYRHITSFCYPRDIFKCDKCSYTTTFKPSLERHITFKHSVIDPKNFDSCPKCGKRFTNLRQRNKHESNCESKQFLSCNICSFQTKYKNQFITHMNRHVHDKKKRLGSNNIQCKVENTISAERKSMAEDTRKLMMNYCSNCDRTTKIEPCLLKCKTCEQALKFRCVKCSSDYSRRKRLYSHITRCHIRCEPEPCLKCGKYLSSHINLKLHLRLCGKVPDLQCDHCPYKAKRKDNLKEHIHSHHMDSKRAVCECGKTFVNRNGLLKHKSCCKKKTTILYQCSYCQVKVNRKYSLMKHVLKEHVDLMKQK